MKIFHDIDLNNNKIINSSGIDMNNHKIEKLSDATNTDDAISSIGDGGSGPCCAKNPTQKNVPKTPPRKKPV